MLLPLLPQPPPQLLVRLGGQAAGWSGGLSLTQTASHCRSCKQQQQQQQQQQKTVVQLAQHVCLML
jgi:hypothetical protein